MLLRTSLKVLGTVGLAQLVVFGCALQGDDSAPPSGSSAPANITVVDTEESGAATFVTGNLGAAVDVRALNRLGSSADLVTLAQAFRSGTSDLIFTRSEADDIGDTHVRFQQQRDGRDVIGGELVVHTRSGSIYAANGSVRDVVPTATVASISATAAVIAAQAVFEKAATTTAGTPDLAYLPREGEADLVYRVEVSGTEADQTPVRDTILVDATTGTVAARFPHIHTAKNRELHNTKQSSTLPGALARKEGASAVTDSTVNGNYDNLGNTYDCYKQLFNRDSFDNAGAKLIATVHYQKKYNNAFWNGTQMVYGDGDGTLLGNLALSIDVTAHELTHAVTERTSGLVYSGQSGGLNESMSDILGNTCEWFKAGRPATPAKGVWQVGEDIYTPGTAGDALRYLSDPAKDGSSLDYYPDYTNGIDVHYSSGISNLAFYLLAQGGKHPRAKTSVKVSAIGIDKAARIFYRANTSIFTSSTTFAAARTATEQAAKQLGYDASVVSAVSAAWKAVGVGR